ncbi:MAG TPA: peptide chain release factor 1 [Bacteroidia bacterium]|nr:peptide chain release factor 1 [Bacteroidia bacterium]
MLDKLEAIKKRWEEVEQKLSDPKTISDMKLFTKLNKEYKDLSEVVEAYHRYKNIVQNIDFNKEILAKEKDEEMKEMAKMDLDELLPKKDKMEDEIRNMLIPKDPEDAKNAVMEIRAGTGGDEASIFAGDLYRMYCRYCDAAGLKTEVVDISEGTAGGFKEVIFNVSGTNAYGKLKFESGVHRVQRVPQTETMGRVHTSTATVIVMPEADEWDIELKESDVRKDIFCSSGPGGQSVNTTKSAIRLTHISTGIVVQCQDQKSQLKNYDKALSVLRSRLYEIEFQKRLAESSKKRKTMVSTGDRSEKIRTYNYPQSRVTDHRIGYSMHNLPSFMNGDIQDVMDALQLAENAERLKEGGMLIS